MATCHLTFGKEYFILKADCDDFVAASTILKIELGPQNPKSHPQTCQWITNWQIVICSIDGWYVVVAPFIGALTICQMTFIQAFLNKYLLYWLCSHKYILPESQGPKYHPKTCLCITNRSLDNWCIVNWQIVAAPFKSAVTFHQMPTFQLPFYHKIVYLKLLTGFSFNVING